MFVAELTDDLWLESLPLDLDVYFEELAPVPEGIESLQAYRRAAVKYVESRTVRSYLISEPMLAAG